jgi:hypothetical protein
LTVAPGRIAFGAITPLSVRPRPPIGSIVLPPFLTARKSAPRLVEPNWKRRLGRGRKTRASADGKRRRLLTRR